MAVAALSLGLAAPVMADEPDAKPVKAAVPEGCPEPQFVHGKQAWYLANIDSYVVERSPSSCEQSLGPLSRVLEYEDRSHRLLYLRCVVDLEVPEDLAEALSAKERSQEESNLPPSKRRSKQDLWKSMVAAAKGQFACPAGTTRAVELNWAGYPMVGCYVDKPPKQFCPRPGTEPKTERSDGPDNLVSCVATRCGPEEVDLKRLTKGGLSGCLRCPAGEPDFKETAAWKATEIALGFAPDTILCRAPTSAKCLPPKEPRGPSYP